MTESTFSLYRLSIVHDGFVPSDEHEERRRRIVEDADLWGSRATDADPFPWIRWAAMTAFAMIAIAAVTLALVELVLSFGGR